MLLSEDPPLRLPHMDILERKSGPRIPPKSDIPLEYGEGRGTRNRVMGQVVKGVSPAGSGMLRGTQSSHSSPPPVYWMTEEEDFVTVRTIHLIQNNNQ